MNESTHIIVIYFSLSLSLSLSLSVIILNHIKLWNSKLIAKENINS